MRLRLLFLPFLFLALTLQAQTPAIQWLKKNGPIGGEILEIEVDTTSMNIFLLDGDNKPYVSKDNGATWSELNYSTNQDFIYDIEITNGTIFLVAYDELYASTDGGDTFSKRMTTTSPYNDGRRLKRMPVSGNLVVLSSSNIYTSANNGQTWTLAGNVGNDDQGYHLEVNALDQVFVLRQNAQFELRPFKSTNSGVSFSEMSTGIPVGHHANSLTAENDGQNIYCTTNEGVFKSDGTSAWASIKTAAITDLAISDVHPGNSYVEFSADGIGMFFVDNANHKLYSKAISETDWVLRSSDFPSANVMANCAAAVDYPGGTSATAYFGSPGGVFKTITGGASSSESNVGISSVKGTQILTDYNAALYLKTYLPNTGTYELMKSQDGGNNWTKLTAAPSPISHFTKTEQSLFAIAGATLYRSYDNGISWDPLAPPPGGFTWAGGTGRDKVFGLTGTSFYYSLDNGANWTPAALVISGFPASAYIYEESICFASPERMFLKLYDYNALETSFYRIDFVYDAGEAITSATATKITTLPIPIDEVYRADAANGKFFAYQAFGASPNRVTISADGGVTWATRTVPEADNFFVVPNGYFFLADDAASDKLYISRDDGVTFEETIFPGDVRLYDLNDITLDNYGYAYLAFEDDYLYQSANSVVLPSAPSDLREIGKSATAVALDWEDLNAYDRDIIVERSLDGATFTSAGRVDGWERCDGSGMRGYYVDSGLAPATAYTYRIKAKNDAGESATAPTIMVTTLASCVPTLPENSSWTAINSGAEDYTLLGAPVAVAIKHLGEGKYQISDLSLSLTGTAEPSTFYESCGETMVGSAGNLNPNGNGAWDGTTLTLKWRACGDNTTETISLTKNATDPAPDKPAALYAYVLTNTSIEIKWATGFYEETYVLERSLSPGSGYAEIATLDYPQRAFIDNGPLTEGLTYYYRLKSRNGNGVPLESPYSDVVSVPFRKPNFVVANNAITNYNQTATLGSVWADFDNDGDEDYLTTQLDLVNEVAKPIVVENLGGGTFEISLVPVGDNPYFWASVVDVDNDHFPDIVMNGDGTRLLDIFKGNGDFTFTKIPSGQLGDLALIKKAITATSWADVNSDGLPDVMLLNDEDGSFTLYKQNADHSFTEIETGEATNDEPLLSIWSDYDNDGDPDVLIGGEGGLYRNNGDETFTRMSGVGIDATDYFSAAWGDYNNDGNMDLFIGSFAGNALFKNNGNGTFTKDATTSISEPNFCVSASWGDFNNDGYLDLMTVGFGPAQSRLFIRDASVTGSVVFKKIITEKINDLSVSHYSVAHGDPETNGQLDLAMSAFTFDDAGDNIGPTNNNFYKNNNTLANWSEVKLKPKTGSTESLGAKVKLTAASMTQTREITAGTSLASKNSMVLHFGLGSATAITNIEITWPNGSVQNYANPPINELLIIDEDFAAPVITFTPPADTPKGANLTLQIPVTDDNVVNGVKVFARKISNGDYVQVDATKGTGDNWEAVLDQTTHFDEMGTEYYIEATDNAGNKTRSPADVTKAHATYLKYAEADTSIPTERLSFGGTLTNWRIIAVPFALTGANNKVQDVFDEFSQLREKVDFRIITYINAEDWLDVKRTDALERGKGYFINILNTLSDIGVGDNINAPANSRSNLHTVNLSQGWNMIGNPYLTQISWDDVVAANPELTGSAAELKKYNGSGYTVQTQTMAPFEGAFVFVENAVPDVSIPFLGQGSSGGRKKGFASLGTDITADAWALKLNVTQGDAVYELSSVGMAPDANSSFDAYDDVTPPRFFSYLEVNFDHPEHFAKRFSRDIVPTQPDYTWDFTVDSNLEGIAELNWDNAPLISAGKDIFLLDASTQTLVNMKEKATYRFDPATSSKFRIYYGDNLSIAPEQVHLGTAYPNPSSGMTTIAFSLPETGGLNQRVNLDIVDALGRTVGTIKQGLFNPGYHEAAFDATEMMNGFYTYRLTVRNRGGHFTEVNKLIIK